MSASQNLTASEVAAIAYALPPISPEGLALVLEIFVYIFSVLATITIILRIWVRAYWLDSESGRGLWGVDDSLAVLGFVSDTTRPRSLLANSWTSLLSPFSSKLLSVAVIGSLF